MTGAVASQKEARRHCWFVDSGGLVESTRDNFAEHKRRYAHEHAPLGSLLDAFESLKPHAIIGVSGTPGMFNAAVLGAMARLNERPVVLALSNPTSKAECTAQEAYAAAGGRAIFASGSPFAPVTFAGRTHVPGQGNNAYIFPGVGLGVIVAAASRVTDEMFAVAARTLASKVTDDDLAIGRVYPSLSRIREVSHAIAIDVATIAFDRGLARRERPADIAAEVTAAMYQPDYVAMVSLTEAKCVALFLGQSRCKRRSRTESRAHYAFSIGIARMFRVCFTAIALRSMRTLVPSAKSSSQ